MARLNRLLIVQPWFTAIGHPAQSLFNTMRCLKHAEDIDYLVSEDLRFAHHANLESALGAGQRLFRFAVSGSVLKQNTVACMWSMVRFIRELKDARRVLFFDMDLVSIARWWRLLAPLMNVEQLTLLYLLGPEPFARQGSARRRVHRLLRRKDVVLCVRTRELEQAWVSAFPDIAPSRIRTLPSLEMPEGRYFPARHCEGRLSLRFGILGQLRRGKSINTLVPLFSSRPDIGILKVAGSFASPAEREALRLLDGFAGFEERYFEDDELLQLTAAQDYLLVLYDQWDKRMESAVLYLAMRANRPVVVYAEGWCDRMIREFGCGVAVSRAEPDPGLILSALALPGSAGYRALLDGVQRFRDAHRAEALLPGFLACVGFAPKGDNDL